MLATESPFPQYFDADGSPLDAGFLYFGAANQNPETSPATVYWDYAGTQPAAQPIRTLNGYAVRNGTPALVYSTTDYSLTVRSRSGALIYYAQSSVAFSVSSQVAALRAALADTANAANGDAMIGVKTPVAGAKDTTQDQVNSERTSVFQLMSTTQIATITADTGAPGAICATELQLGLDGLVLSSLPHGTYQIDTPLRIKNGTSRATLRGDTRIRSILQPNAVSIAVAGGANVNALIVNQDNNPHFCMENLRMTSSVAYTGMGIYCVENGGADGLGQCMFSGIFRNLWIDFASTNAGFLTGATQNTVFDTITFENMKGCFNLQGVGNGDNFYTNISLSTCYDQLILQTTDTNGSFAATVRGVHAYGHQRGRLLDVQNWFGGAVDDVYFEALTGNLGGTGIGRFKACTGTMLSNLYALTRAGVPACAIGLEFDTFVGKVTQGAINADIGVRFSGTGAQSIVFVNQDFTDCTTACMQWFGNFPGTIRTIGCKFNRSQVSCAVFQVASSCDWYSTDDEFLDAGLGGNVASRNLSLTTSGKVVMTRPKIGRTTGSAVASAWIEATGTGTVDIYDPIFIGTPPTSIMSGVSTQVVNVHVTQPTGFTRVTTATYTVLDSDRDIVVNFAGTCTLTLPAAGTSGAFFGRRLNVRTVTGNAVVSASANVCPSTTQVPGTAILAATAGKGAELVYELANSVWQNQLSN